MSLVTQIGGKYTAEDNSIFILKQLFLEAGIAVTHPIASSIQYNINGTSYAFDINAQPFEEVELDYYRSIAASSFHTVCNTYVRQHGYLGVSASRELCFALLRNRPIWLCHAPIFSDEVVTEVRAIVAARVESFSIADPTRMDRQGLARHAQGLTDVTVNYCMTSAEVMLTTLAVREFLGSLGCEEAAVDMLLPSAQS